MDSTVTTLDGKFWDKDEILEKMRDDEFYYGYLGSNALSSSSCTYLLDSPLKYQRSLSGVSQYSDAFSLGSLVHYRILEPEKFYNMNFVNVKSKRTKMYQEAVAEYGASKTFTLTEKYNAEDLSDVFLNNSICTSMLHNAKYEEPMMGEIDGIPFRGKADALSNIGLLDLKTTSGGIRSFRKSAFKYNYDMQCYIYCTLFDVSYKEFTWAVIDKSSKGLGIFKCSKDFYKSGKAKTEAAINIFRDYFVDKKKAPEEFYLLDVL